MKGYKKVSENTNQSKRYSRYLGVNAEADQPQVSDHVEF